MDVKENLKYTKDHEWVKLDGNIATVGITDFAQGELGDIVYVEVDTVDETLDKDEVFGTVEAVKTVSDLFLPMSGKIIEFNESLSDSPESINDSPYEKGWIIKVEVSNLEEINDLLNNNDYSDLIG
ncbi:MAG: glycine cleavage system protein H [Flavobacteriales bacterium]|nr:glycine cleavage system protein H [Flavobacteriales bacterium]|tara:strand:- start:438 stop:815 length:378 start_codon:yes stop_codon:yes gene_type:complete